MGNQTLLVLLGMVLFSTVLLATNNSLFLQAEAIYKKIYTLQGQRIALKYFDKIDAEVLIANLSFDQIRQKYSEYNDILTLEELEYNVHIVSNYCDNSGDINLPDSSYQRIDIDISCNSHLLDTIRIGYANNPISKVITDMGL